jgi:general secretion pathway protein D
MRSRLLTLLLLLPLLASSVARAQDEARARIGSEGTVNLDFQGAELTDVIGTISDLTGKNFLYDEKVRGQVTLVSPTPVTVEEAYRVFEAILQVKGFTTVPGPGGVLKIVPLRTAKEHPIETVSPGAHVPDRDLYITRLIPLRYVKADAIANTLRPLVSKDANLVSYAPTNTIILTDTAASVRRLLTIIAEIDVETYEEQIKVVPIEHADAGSITRHLEQIFGRPQDRTARTRRARTTRQQAAQGAAANVSFGEAGEPRFITDERTNSIIVIAPQGTIRQVENLIRLLDYRRKGSGRVHVVRLQNADAEELAQTLARLASGAGGGGAPAAAQATAESATVAELAAGVRVTADAPTNSLIVQATSEGFTAVRDVIEALDIRRPQVMIEALIMEVQVTDQTILGSAFLYQTLLGGNRIAVGSNTGETALNAAAAAAEPGFEPGDFTAAVLGRFIEVTDPTGVITQVPVIQAVITAAGADDDNNIIAAPTLLTADNEEAQIIVGENVPIVTQRVASAAGQAVGVATAQNVERQDVGVTLRVTPQISEGDTVRLTIFQEISTVISENNELGPTLRQRSVENTVYVQDTEAVMIGGIIQESQDEVVSKVPWLGDIPILGWAFKSTTETLRKTNLIVILTPHIVRDPGDLEQLTVERRERFRSEAGDSLDLTEDDREARKKALQAGLELPRDPNPVRRELERHESRHPTEELPLLRREQLEREEERRQEMKELERAEGGEYRVLVSSFDESGPAIELLQKLLARGYDGTVLSRKQGDRVRHGVELGPYVTEARAQHVARELGVELGLEVRVLIEP